MRALAIAVLVLVGALFFAAAGALPPMRGDSNPISRHVEPYYLSRTLEDTDTPNFVTAILADYRSYDTFGETTVVFAAGLACYLLLRRFRE